LGPYPQFQSIDFRTGAGILSGFIFENENLAPAL